MGKKNSFLARQRESEDAMFNAGMEMGLQMMADCFQLVLNDPDVMGKGVFGYGRMDKIGKAVQERVDHYADACNIRKAEADYLQEKLDSGLRKIWGDKLVPFAERYPMLKSCKY